jgi:hypothetical protein
VQLGWTKINWPLLRQRWAMVRMVLAVEQMKLKASRTRPVVNAPLMVAHWAAEGCWPVAIHAPADLDFLFRQQLSAGKGW